MQLRQSSSPISQVQNSLFGLQHIWLYICLHPLISAISSRSSPFGNLSTHLLIAFLPVVYWDFAAAVPGVKYMAVLHTYCMTVYAKYVSTARMLHAEIYHGIDILAVIVYQVPPIPKAFEIRAPNIVRGWHITQGAGPYHYPGKNRCPVLTRCLADGPYHAVPYPLPGRIRVVIFPRNVIINHTSHPFRFSYRRAAPRAFAACSLPHLAILRRSANGRSSLVLQYSLYALFCFWSR